MRTYIYNINGAKLTVSVDEAAGAVARVALDGGELSIPEENEAEAVAAIALAIDKAVNEEVHDDESGVITIGGGSGRWNAPGFNFKTVNKATH